MTFSFSFRLAANAAAAAAVVPVRRRVPGKLSALAGRRGFAPLPPPAVAELALGGRTRAGRDPSLRVPAAALVLRVRRRSSSSDAALTCSESARLRSSIACLERSTKRARCVSSARLGGQAESIGRLLPGPIGMDEEAAALRAADSAAAAAAADAALAGTTLVTSRTRLSHRRLRRAVTQPVGMPVGSAAPPSSCSLSATQMRSPPSLVTRDSKTFRRTPAGSLRTKRLLSSCDCLTFISTSVSTMRSGARSRSVVGRKVPEGDHGRDGSVGDHGLRDDEW